MNEGPAEALRVRAWAAHRKRLARDRTDRLAHAAGGDSQWYPLRLDIPRQHSDTGDLRLFVSWQDAAGQHEEALLEITRLREEVGFDRSRAGRRPA